MDDRANTLADRIETLKARIAELEGENERLREGPAILSKDDARLALFKAIQAIKMGNPTDDKLILENLRLAGAWICHACAWCGQSPIRETLDGEALCQSCCDAWVKSEGQALTEEQQDG